MILSLLSLLTLSFDSYLVLSTGDKCSDNINLYSINDNIIAYDNEHKIWEQKLNEPIISDGASYLQIGEGLEDVDVDPLCKYCNYEDFNIEYPPDCLIKLVSKNYIYYLNTTNGNTVNKFHIIDNSIKNQAYVNCYNIRLNTWCIRDVIYNGSIYISRINNNWASHDKCMDGPNVGSKCINNNVSIKLKILLEKSKA
jgi:hypothetical protein